MDHFDDAFRYSIHHNFIPMTDFNKTGSKGGPFGGKDHPLKPSTTDPLQELDKAIGQLIHRVEGIMKMPGYEALKPDNKLMVHGVLKSAIRDREFVNDTMQRR